MYPAHDHFISITLLIGPIVTFALSLTQIVVLLCDTEHMSFNVGILRPPVCSVRKRSEEDCLMEWGGGGGEEFQE